MTLITVITHTGLHIETPDVSPSEEELRDNPDNTSWDVWSPPDDIECLFVRNRETDVLYDGVCGYPAGLWDSSGFLDLFDAPLETCEE